VTPLVVGLGQPFGGDDRVGLVIAERLRNKGVRAISITDATLLVDMLVGAEKAIVIDAVVGSGAPGSVIEMEGDELASHGACAPVSTHGLSIAGAVAIAKTLGGAASVRFVGVLIRPPDRASTTLSPEVEAAVPAAVDLVLRLCAAPSKEGSSAPASSAE